MNRILVIEPSQMLRHAFAVALSPEYQVETLADFPDESFLDRADLVVVNAATLKISEKLDGNDLDMVHAWEKPVIWIDMEQGAEPNELSQCIRLTRSEERRVGKECRDRWSAEEYKKNRRRRRQNGRSE